MKRKPVVCNVYFNVLRRDTRNHLPRSGLIFWRKILILVYFSYFIWTFFVVVFIFVLVQSTSILSHGFVTELKLHIYIYSCVIRFFNHYIIGL